MPKKKTASWLNHPTMLGSRVAVNRSARRFIKKMKGAMPAPMIFPMVSR